MCCECGAAFLYIIVFMFFSSFIFYEVKMKYDLREEVKRFAVEGKIIARRRLEYRTKGEKRDNMKKKNITVYVHEFFLFLFD